MFIFREIKSLELIQVNAFDGKSVLSFAFLPNNVCVFPFCSHSDYGFVEFQLETDADYALKVMNMVKVYLRPMRCNKAAQDKRTLEVGANLFIGNLDGEVDDQLLFDTFSSFGNLLNAKVSRLCRI